MTLYEKWELKRMSTKINLPVPNYPEYSDEKIIKSFMSLITCSVGPNFMLKILKPS